MHPNLVRPAGLELEGDRRPVGADLEQAPARAGRPSAACQDGHFFAIARMAPDGRFNRALALAGTAAYKAEVVAPRRSGLDLGLQAAVGCIRFGNGHCAASVAIKAVDDARTLGIAQP
jgi:hypothetical protein